MKIYPARIFAAFFFLGFSLFLAAGLSAADIPLGVNLDGYEGLNMSSGRLDQTTPLHPQFKDRLASAGVIRFMKMTKVNGHQCSNGVSMSDPSCVQTWAARVQLSDNQTISGRGMAWENVLLIADTADVDAWLSLPVAVDDDYVRQLARVALNWPWQNPQRKIYIELGNEVWLGGGIQDYMYAKGAQVFSLPTTPSDNEVPDAANLYYVRRCLEIFSIFEQEWGTQKNRLVKILGGHNSSTNRTKRLFHALGDPRTALSEPYTPGTQISALAVNPYFGVQPMDAIFTDYDAGRITGVTYGDVLNRTSAGLNSTINDFRNQQALVDDFSTQTVDGTQNIDFRHGYPVRLVAYEGGQHLVVNESNDAHPLAQAVRDVYIQINRSPDMRDFYRQLFDAWYSDTGNSLFVHFAYAKPHNNDGYWGLLERIDQPIVCDNSMNSCCKYVAFQERAAQLLGAPPPPPPPPVNPPASPSNLRVR